jgi:cell division septation protein DedD
MASDPEPDRLRLVIEPSAIERAHARSAQDADRALTATRSPEDMIDVDTFDLEDEDDFPDEEPPRRRRALPIAIALIALAGFGAVTWWAYTTQLQPSSEEAMPLIKADAGPIKTRPADPGGMEVPYQDKLVLNETAPDPNQPQVERLLPPPEVPRPPASQTGDTAAATGAGGQETAAATPTQSGPDLSPAAGTSAVQPAPPAAAPAKPVVPAPPSQAAQVPAPAAKAPAVPPPATEATPVQTASRGSYLIQVASLKDRSLVDGEWARVQKSFGDVLVGKELVVQTADLGSRGTFHRVRVGYFADHDSAAAVCQKLEAKKQACIVVKQ